MKALMTEAALGAACKRSLRLRAVTPAAATCYKIITIRKERRSLVSLVNMAGQCTHACFLVCSLLSSTSSSVLAYTSRKL